MERYAVNRPIRKRRINNLASRYCDLMLLAMTGTASSRLTELQTGEHSRNSVSIKTLVPDISTEIDSRGGSATGSGGLSHPTQETHC